MASSIKAFVVANPALTFAALATAAASVGIAIYANLHPSLEKASKDLKEKKEEFDSIAKEVSDLSSELEKSKKRMAELQSLGTLSLVENDELNKLKKTTTELETQLAIKKEEQRMRAKETAITANKAFNGTFRSKYDENGELITGDAGHGNNPIEELENSIKAYYKLQEQYNKAKQNADFYALQTEKDGGKYSLTGQVDWAEYEKYAKQMGSIQKQMYSASIQANKMYDTINSQKEAYEGLYNAGYDLNQEQVNEYETVRLSVEAYNDFCSNINDTTKAFSELNAEQKRLKLETQFILSGKSEEEAKDIVKSLNDDDLDVVASIRFDSSATKDSVRKTLDEIKNSEKLELEVDLTFAGQLTSLPFDKVEELVALFKSGAIDENTISSYKELNAIMIETGLSAEDAIKELKDLSENYTLPSEMISNLQEVSDLINSLENREMDKIDTSSLEKIVKLYPEMESALSNYTIGLVNEQQLIDELKDHYDVDMKNYGNYMIAKNQENLDFANAVGLNSAEVVNQFFVDYGIDIGNHTTYAQKKIAIEQQTLQTISDMWAKYYNAQARSLTEAGQALEDAVISGAAVNDPESIALYNKLHEQTRIYENAVDALNNISYDGIGANFNGVKSTSGSGNSSGGSKGAKSKDPTEFDWMEQKIDILNSQIDKLKTNIDSLVGYKNKNSMTNTAIDVLTEKMSVLQQMHDKYMEEASKLNLSQEYINKIQNGSIEIESIADENLAKIIQEYQDLFEKAESANDQIIETTQSIHDLNLAKLDNIVNQFEQLTDIQSQIIDTEEQLLDLHEKTGEEVYMDDYISLAGKQLNLTRQNADAYNTLSAEMAKMNLKEGSDDWKKYNDQLQAYKSNMITAANAVEQYKDAMAELAFKGLGDFKNSMDSINGTINTMNGLIGNNNLIDDFGKLTDRGLAQVALYAHQMTNAKQEAAEYAKAIESLDDALDSGLITQDDYNSMLQEYTTSQESAVKSSKEARDAILTLVKEGIQAEIDAKKRLIDETKAALDAEKNLHDYQNSIAKKQDNISKLERQIAVLSNSTNREDIAQRLQLQSQLADAKKELYETQYDHEIEQRKEALDKEYTSFEESKQKESDELDSNLDAQNAAINKYLEQARNNYSTVYGILTQYGDEYNLSAIDNLTTPWEAGSDAANLCSDAISDAVGEIQYEINGLDFSPLYELVTLLDQIGLAGYGDLSYKDVTDRGSWKKAADGIRWWYGNSNDDYVSNGIYTINGKQYGFDNSGYMATGWSDSFGDWRYFEPENGEMVKSTWRKDSKGDWYYLDKDGVMATDMAVKANEGDGYYYLDKEGKWDNHVLSAEQVRKLGYRIGYRKGTTNARKGWNLMDEDGLGSESIVTKEGRLVQFKGGETVFNPKMTENLWKLAQDPTKLVAGLNNLQTNTIDLSKIKPVEKEQKVEVNMNIGGVLDEAAARVLSEQMPAMIKKHQRELSETVYKDIKYTLSGK